MGNHDGFKKGSGESAVSLKGVCFLILQLELAATHKVERAYKRSKSHEPEGTVCYSG